MRYDLTPCCPEASPSYPCTRTGNVQSELCRLARVVDHKAERGEVEAALKLKASKVSVQKRLVAVAEEDEVSTPP